MPLHDLLADCQTDAIPRVFWTVDSPENTKDLVVVLRVDAEAVVPY
jgi:hypothetical protein